MNAEKKNKWSVFINAALTALLPLLRMGKPSQKIHSITNRWVHPIHHRRPVHPASLYQSC